MIHPVQVIRNARARWRGIRRMDVAPDDVVLEVGSGQNPSPRANVLCDRHVVDETERNLQPLVLDRPFVVGDVYSLPFRDGAFDYVVCSHLLEHVDDPAAAIRELERVAPRGYVETPSRANEKVLSHPFHRWTVTDEDGALVFREKERAILDPELREWFSALSEHVPGFADRYLNRLHEIGAVVARVWEERIPHRVERRPSPDAGPEFTAATALSPAREIEAIAAYLRDPPSPGLSQRVWSLAGRLLRRRSDPKVILPSMLACPACGSGVTRTLDGWRCTEEGRFFPVVGGRRREIPYLVGPGLDR